MISDGFRGALDHKHKHALLPSTVQATNLTDVASTASSGPGPLAAQASRRYRPGGRPAQRRNALLKLDTSL